MFIFIIDEAAAPPEPRKVFPGPLISHASIVSHKMPTFSSALTETWRREAANGSSDLPLFPLSASFVHLCCVRPARSPPRPSPGSLHYSDEDVSTKYNDLIPAESSSLTEKPSEISDSQVSALILVLPHSGFDDELQFNQKKTESEQCEFHTARQNPPGAKVRISPNSFFCCFLLVFFPTVGHLITSFVSAAFIPCRSTARFVFHFRYDVRGLKVKSVRSSSICWSRGVLQTSSNTLLIPQCEKHLNGSVCTCGAAVVPPPSGLRCEHMWQSLAGEKHKSRSV